VKSCRMPLAGDPEAEGGGRRHTVLLLMLSRPIIPISHSVLDVSQFGHNLFMFDLVLIESLPWALSQV
jgi:hypothetical protein